MCLVWRWRRRDGCLPWLSVEVLFMSPEMKEDSDCFLTVSFHIRLMRLWVEKKGSHWSGLNTARLLLKAFLPQRVEWLCEFVLQTCTCTQKKNPAHSPLDDMFVFRYNKALHVLLIQPKMDTLRVLRFVIWEIGPEQHFFFLFSSDAKSRSICQIPRGALKIALTKTRKKILPHACIWGFFFFFYNFQIGSTCGHDNTHMKEALGVNAFSGF